jgi:acetyl-CoA C-acetyltransferase
VTGVSIAGVGSTAFGRHDGRTPQDLGIMAARDAILDAGIDRGDIDAVYLGNFVSGVLTGQEVLAGLVAHGLGLSGVPATKVEGACASGGIAFRHAVMAVASGQARAALAVGVEVMTGRDTPIVTGALNCALDNASDGATGLSFPGFFGLVWRAHAARHGTSRAQVGAVAMKNKRHGLKNPLASLGADLTQEAVASSRLVADPIRLLDCCGVSDGAAAVVVTASGRLPRHGASPNRCARRRADQRAATLLGLRRPDELSRDGCGREDGLRPGRARSEGHRSGGTARLFHHRRDHRQRRPRPGAPRSRAGSGPSKAEPTSGGTIPINPSGGLLAKGHPVGATGLGQVYEVVRQLRGEHPNPVGEARIGMAHNLGGAGIACTVSILGRVDG